MTLEEILVATTVAGVALATISYQIGRVLEHDEMRQRKDSLSTLADWAEYVSLVVFLAIVSGVIELVNRGPFFPPFGSTRKRVKVVEVVEDDSEEREGAMLDG